MIYSDKAGVAEAIDRVGKATREMNAALAEAAALDLGIEITLTPNKDTPGFMQVLLMERL